MKKLMLFVTGVGLLAACVAQQQSKVYQTELASPDTAVQTVQEDITAKAAKPIFEKDCKINGHACWDVVQKLGKTKETVTPNTNKDDIWAPDTVTYENPDLAAWGIKVTFYTMYRDGGSTTYILDDKVSIHTNRSLGIRNTLVYGMVTIKFKENGKQFVYDAQGDFHGDGSVFPN